MATGKGDKRGGFGHAPAGYSACLTAIQEAAGGVLTDDDLERVLEEVIRRRRFRAGEAPLDAGDAAAMAKIGKTLSEEEQRAALIERRSMLHNLQVRSAALEQIRSDPKGPSAGLSAFLVGSERAGPGMAKSVDSLRLGLEGGVLNGLVHELRLAGALPMLQRRDADFERELAREMWVLNDTELRNPKRSDDPMVRQIGDIFTRWGEAVRVMQNDSGAWIGRTPGYVVRQAHDQTRVAGGGKDADYQAWRDFIAPRLDERTYERLDSDTPAEREKFLRETWLNLASGTHLKASGGSEWLTGFKGPGNLAKKLSAERVLHFTGPDAWFDYNQRFGVRSVVEAFVGGLQHGARNTAVLRTLGTNPEAMFDHLRDRLTKDLLDAGKPGEASELQKSWLRQSEFDQVSGAAAISGSPNMAHVGSTVRNLVAMAKLGGVVLSSFPDIALRVATLRHNGVGFLEGYADALGAIFRGRGSEAQHAIAEELGVGSDGILGSIHARVTSLDDVPGRMSKMLQRFYSLNLLNWWTESHKIGTGLVLSHNLARNLDRGFDELHPMLRGNLERYGVTADDWKMMGSLRDVLRDGGGRAHFTPDLVRMLDPEAVRTHLEDREIASRTPGPRGGMGDTVEISDRAVRSYGDDLESKLRAYFVEQVRESMTEPGARERAMVSLGTKPGTLAGEGLRFLAQFKTYPVTVATRHLGRELVREGNVDVAGLASMIVATTALGYLSYAAKDLAKGRTPRGTDGTAGGWAKIIGASLQQGGGLGIWGDYLFGDFNRFGGGAIETAAGPMAGMIGDALRMFSQTKESIEAGGKGGASLLSHFSKFAVDQAPFMNMFYSRQAFDYLVLYQFQEWMNPGFLARYERRVQKENNNTFLLKPSDVVGHGGGAGPIFGN